MAVMMVELETRRSVADLQAEIRELARTRDAVILAHNHPSGVCEPSQADQLITQRLREALALVDIRVLDHCIVADNGCLSFAERGLL